MSDIFSSLGLFLGLFTGLGLSVLLLWRYPLLIAVVALGLPVIHESFQLGPDAFEFSGLTFYLEDIGCALLLLAGLIVAARSERLPERQTWPALLLLGLVVINLVRGVALFGLKPATNASRLFIYFAVPAIAVMLLQPTLRVSPKRLANWLIAGACVLALAALLRWARIISMEPSTACALCGNDMPLDDDLRELPRALPAEYAILIGQSLLAAIYLQLRRGVRWWDFVGVASLAALTFALQHRTVWAATTIGLLWMMARSWKWSRHSSAQIAGATLLSLLLVAIFAGNRIAVIAAENLHETQQEGSTWNWRVSGFVEASQRLLGGHVSEILLGPPSGVDLGEQASFASVHIHSRYVSTFAYYGLFGLGVLLMWLFAVGKKLRAAGAHSRRAGIYAHPTDAIFLQALFLSQLIYFVAYAGQMTQGALMMLVWASASQIINVDSVLLSDSRSPHRGSSVLVPTALREGHQ